MVCPTYDLKRKSVEVSSKSVAFNLFVQSRRYRNFSSKSPPHLPTTLVLTKILLSFEIISMLMKQRLSFVSTKRTKKTKAIALVKTTLFISKSSWLQPGLWSRKKLLCEKFWMLAAGTGARNLSLGSTVLIPNTVNLAPGYYLQVFKAGCKSVSLRLLAFPPVLFISRRLRYLLRMCSTWLKLAQKHISSETSVVILA